MIIFDSVGVLQIDSHPSREPDNFVFIDGLPYALPFVLGSGYHATYIDLKVYNKSTLKSTTILDIEATYNNGVITFETPFDFIENTQYYLIVTEAESTSDGKLLFNSNALFTEQGDLQDFELTKGVYQEGPKSSNEYIQY